MVDDGTQFEEKQLIMIKDDVNKERPIIDTINGNSLILDVNLYRDHTTGNNCTVQTASTGVWLGDWGGPPAELVRLIAKRKK